MGIVQAVHRKTGKTGVEVKALAGEILLVLLREKLLCYTIFVTVYLVIDIEKARTKCWL